MKKFETKIPVLFSHISYYGYMILAPLLIVICGYHAVLGNGFALFMAISFLIVFVLSIKTIKKQHKNDVQHFKAGE